MKKEKNKKTRSSSTLNKSILEKIRSEVLTLEKRLIKFRREIHENPELSGGEVETASFIAGVLEDNDIEVKKNLGGHGLVGLLRGTLKKDSKKTIALRADMDALPINDNKKTKYASKVEGVMHACGHDVHSAILMGTAIVLSRMKNDFSGNVKFIFQPSEEVSGAGADVMIAEGVLKNPKPSAIIALHCYPELGVGKIAHHRGTAAASADAITIKIKGKSGHASRPHQSVDAILVSALVLNSLHHLVSRRIDPLQNTVISIGKIKGGTAQNIIASSVEMQGTVRTLDTGVRKKMPTMIENVLRGVTLSMGAEYEFSYDLEIPQVENDPKIDGLLRRSAVLALGKDNVIELEKPLMGSEDFAFFT
ncbi:MAG: amidohydrolase, partial [Deltaproteobacteria bacterium]|nr:amidohydrolase [Deltaproteobacteria bacterium]